MDKAGWCWAEGTGKETEVDGYWEKLKFVSEGKAYICVYIHIEYVHICVHIYIHTYIVTLWIYTFIPTSFRYEYKLYLPHFTSSVVFLKHTPWNFLQCSPDAILKYLNFHFRPIWLVTFREAYRTGQNPLSRAEEKMLWQQRSKTHRNLNVLFVNE